MWVYSWRVEGGWEVKGVGGEGGGGVGGEEKPPGGCLATCQRERANELRGNEPLTHCQSQTTNTALL